jgi:hypothetical protein
MTQACQKRGGQRGSTASMIGRLHHLIVDCPDPLALATFYAELLGQPARQLLPGRNVPGTFGAYSEPMSGWLSLRRAAQAGAVAGIPAASVATLIAARRPGNPIGWLLFGILLAG